MSTKAKPLQILRAMWAGIPLEHGGDVFHLLDREDGKGKALCVAVEKMSLQDKETTTEYLGYDITLNDFLVVLEQVPDEVATIMSADCVLTEINREGGPTRLGSPKRRKELLDDRKGTAWRDR